MAAVTLATIKARYGELRTLRTRATGTPFRAVWRDDHLAVIPNSGIERRVPVAELRQAWPLIRAGATKKGLREITDNGSYVEAIFDDVASGGSGNPEASLQTVDASVHETVAEENKSLRDQLALAETRAEDLHARLQHVTDRASALQRASRKDSGLDELESQVWTLRGDLRSARLELAESQIAAETATARAMQLQAQLERVPTQLVLTLKEKTFSSEHDLHPDLWTILHEAGSLALKRPSASIAESRRAIETAIGYLWREASRKQGKPTMALMLEELHGNPLLPLPDWHLAKTLYRQSSEVVHSGTRRPDLALWLFFGALQICELVRTSDRPEG